MPVCAFCFCFNYNGLCCQISFFIVFEIVNDLFVQFFFKIETLFKYGDAKD